jgi:hypothetical protein
MQFPIEHPSLYNAPLHLLPVDVLLIQWRMARGADDQAARCRKGYHHFQASTPHKPNTKHKGTKSDAQDYKADAGVTQAGNGGRFERSTVAVIGVNLDEIYALR